MAKRYFLTGTDTDVGKTQIASALLYRAKTSGLTTFGLKPVAAGCELNDQQQLVNEDALLLQSQSSERQPYAIHNPIAFEPPIAPHIAAEQLVTEQAGSPLTLEGLVQACQPGLNIKADFTLVEGAGGWLVPINHSHSLADFALALDKQQGFEVIVVVGLRLGCISHACLTLEVIRASGLKVAGWVGNCLADNMDVQQQNIDYLSGHFGKHQIPCLGITPFLPQLEAQQRIEQLAQSLILPS